MAKKKEEVQVFEDVTIKDSGIKSGLSFMSFDRSNFTGRVRMAVDAPQSPEMGLGLSRVVLDMQLPDDFDREKYIVTGELSVAVSVKIKKEWLEQEAKAAGEK